MKITPENYKEAIERALSIADPRNQWISELPEKIREGHEFLLEATDSFSDWNVILNDKEYREIIEMYFTELSKYIEEGEQSQPQPVKQTQNKSKPARENKKENQSKNGLQRKNYNLLRQFIPGFENFLSKLTVNGEFTDKSSEIYLRMRKLQPHGSIFDVHLRKNDLDNRDYDEDSESYDDAPHHWVECDLDVDIVKKTVNATEGYIKYNDQNWDRVDNLNFGTWLESSLAKKITVKLPKTLKSHSEKKALKSARESKGKKVEHITEEVKFIKRYVGLHNKVKSRSAILALIKSLQRSIVQKLIRKTSAFAEEIRTIQEKLVDAYNKTKGDELKFSINENDLSRLVGIAGGEEVYQSVKIIKRYVGLQGREPDEKTLEGFLKQIEKAIKSMKVSQDDPYYEEVKSIQASVKKLMNGTKVKIGKSELHGLEGILNGCGCTENSPSKTRKHRGLGSITPGVMSAEQMANLTVEELNFTYPWDLLLGKPATNFSVMFHGDPGSGKTTLLLKFVEYLANNFGRVLYVSSEEHGASTLVKKINALLPVRPSRLDFAANLTEPDLSQYDFIVLDSVNNLKLRLDDFKQLKRDNPHASFILVLQHTKDGNYRGGKDWEHDTEIAVKVERGVATVYRTRYGVYGALDFFSHFNITPELFK